MIDIPQNTAYIAVCRIGLYRSVVGAVADCRGVRIACNASDTFTGIRQIHRTKVHALENGALFHGRTDYASDMGKIAGTTVLNIHIGIYL